MRCWGLAVAVVLVVGCRCGGNPRAGEDAAACLAAPAPLDGQATYYAADGTGSCGFDVDPGRMVAAIAGPDYDHAAWCGGCVMVTGPAGEVVVRIVDECPGCKHGDLDLSAEAFAVLSPLSAGRIPITWHEVACDVAGTISYQFKDGSNPYWAGIQVRNHRYPIAKLEARDAMGNYAAIARADYNYFVAASGLGAGPFALRVTDARGEVLEDGAIELGAAVSRPGASQFPACP